jgi:hypothetical protein
MELLVGPQLTQTSDHAEGTAAFKQKRKLVSIGPLSDTSLAKALPTRAGCLLLYSGMNGKKRCAGIRPGGRLTCPASLI